MSDLTNLYVSEFYGMEVICVTSESLGTLVVAKPLSDSLGLNWERQRERLNSYPLFNPVVIKGSDILNSAPSDDSKLYAGISIMPGSMYLCIPSSQVALWILSIAENKTSGIVRDRLLRCKSLISKRLSGSYITTPLSAVGNSLI